MFKNIGKDFGKDFGQNLQDSSIRVKEAGSEIRIASENVRIASENLRDGFIKGIKIAVLGWIIVKLIE